MVHFESLRDKSALSLLSDGRGKGNEFYLSKSYLERKLLFSSASKDYSYSAMKIYNVLEIFLILKRC